MHVYCKRTTFSQEPPGMQQEAQTGGPLEVICAGLQGDQLTCLFMNMYMTGLTTVENLASSEGTMLASGLSVSPGLKVDSRAMTP